MLSGMAYGVGHKTAAECINLADHGAGHCGGQRHQIKQ